MSSKLTKVDSEVAKKEVLAFVKKYRAKEFRRGTLTAEKVNEEYIDTIEAVEDGQLVFENNKPKYTLEEPLWPNAEDKALTITSVSFRSRIKEGEKTEVMNGLDIEKERGTYVLKLISWITQLSVKDVKELGKVDYNVLNQICSVF